MSREILIQFADSVAMEGSLIGKKVVWKNETTTLTGHIVGFHGKKGMLRARFKKGVPGQAIGTTVELVS
jgi:large subunit ribosomal protein L35Ae